MIDPVARDWLVRGKRAWPQLDLDAVTFIDYVRARVEDSFVAYIEDLFLACACVANVVEAHRALDESYIKPVAAQIARADRTAQAKDELRQLVGERLLVAADGRSPRLAKYSGRSALSAWIKVVALRLALNLRRQRTDDLTLGDGDAPIVAGDAEMLLMKNRFRPHFDAAFTHAMARLKADERQLLRFSVCDGLSIVAIAGLRGVDKATISRHLAAARAKLFRWTHEELRGRLGTARAEADSLIRLVRSQFRDVSFARLLR